MSLQAVSKTLLHVGSVVLKPFVAGCRTDLKTTALLSNTGHLSFVPRHKLFPQLYYRLALKPGLLN